MIVVSSNQGKSKHKHNKRERERERERETQRETRSGDSLVAIANRDYECNYFVKKICLHRFQMSVLKYLREA